MPFENNGEGDSEGIGVRTIYIFNRGSRGGSNKSTRLGGHWAGGPSFGLVVPSDMRFVQNFTPPEFQAKTFTPSISPNFNSFSDKNTKKMSENGEIYTADKNFTLPPAVTALTNSTSDQTKL